MHVEYNMTCHINQKLQLVRGGPASQPQSTPSCWKNLDRKSQKNLNHLNLVIAFRIAWTLDVKIVWFGSQVAVCVRKRHKNAIFWCSRFQKFNFDCSLHKLLICSLTTENIFNFVCLLWTKSSIMISGTQIYFTKLWR